MLNKQVCINCINQNAVAMKLMYPEQKAGWNREDEKDWSEGYVYCPKNRRYENDSVLYFADVYKICNRKREHKKANKQRPAEDV